MHQSTQHTRNIEVFSAGCPLCEQTVRLVEEAVLPCGCAVIQRPWDHGPRSVRRDADGHTHPLPSIAVDGQVIHEGVPRPEQLLFLRRHGTVSGHGVRRGRPVMVMWDGQPLKACEGQTIAAALAAAGHRVLRWTTRRGAPRGVFCGMGVCFDCLVQVDGRPNVQACLTPVRDGMTIHTQRGVGHWRWEDEP